MALPHSGPSSDRSPLWALQVWRCPEGESHSVRLLAYSDLGLLAHYVKPRSHWCPGEGCNPAYHRVPPQWKGYHAAELYIQRVKKWAPIVLEASEHLETDMRNIAKRGQVWLISRDRATGTKRAPITGTLTEELDPQLFPPPFDVLPNLRLLYHRADVRLDLRNPMPLRTVVGYSDGPPPAGLVETTDAERLATQELLRAELQKRHGERFKSRNGTTGAKNP